MKDKKTVCIATGTRAEYGLLKPLIAKICEDDTFEMKLAITGTHLSKAFGETYREIEHDGYSIHCKIELPLDSDTQGDMSRATGEALIAFTDYFENNRPDILIVLGDRFEMLATSVAASMLHIPIAHVSGGDTSEGAIDEFIRHSITKMSYLHFPTNEQSERRIIQLGESPERVFNVGALNVDNILSRSLLSKEELSDVLDCDLSKDYALITFHPVTMNEDTNSNEFTALLETLEQFSNLKCLFTYANADSGGRRINKMIDSYVAINKNCVVFASLGSLRYLSAMKYASVVIGNSSSGLYETPSFGVPCVNIGDRQKGRLRAENVIDSEPEAGAIKNAICRALSDEFKKIAQITISPFGDGYAAERIKNEISRFLYGKKIHLKKSFFDVCSIKSL